NEEKATYAVRGTDAPDIDVGVAAIRNVVQTLPVRPGVYRMQDARGEVLYVGKARALKNPVTNYTQVSRLSKRLQRMVAQTRSMQIVTTNTEAEALLLEAQLIKRYRPPYNVLLRDDKSFPFILLREDHPFPQVSKHRGARRHKGQYYGPFASAGSVTRTLNALQKPFLSRSCTDTSRPTRQGTPSMAGEGLGDADIFALAAKGGTICVQAFFIRGGNNWGHRSFFPAHVADLPEEEVLAAFLMQFYEEVPPPKTILLDREVPE